MLNSIRAKAAILSAIADISEGKMKPFASHSVVEYCGRDVSVFTARSYAVQIESEYYIVEFCKHRLTFRGDREPYRTPSRKIGKVTIDLPKNGNVITVWY